MSAFLEDVGRRLARLTEDVREGRGDYLAGLDEMAEELRAFNAAGAAAARRIVTMRHPTERDPGHWTIADSLEEAQVLRVLGEERGMYVEVWRPETAAQMKRFLEQL